ncbi:microtubule-associated tumor suppressor 1 homolog isoform X3 [Phyllopteryx taeniolatus]|uniref:microtubule-associated tumor suppressor 1 homolog isoform X3 n=1 Tax=Phyllopteryx taeniolatus TaxID=161469 RepID=UPI002AD43613|nr:microtubule-associated tumor suppressor 1 homolog isoform X3 [Phyllopteryx taeniolatus]
MSVSKSSERVTDEKSDTGMRLTLHSAGHHNGNAFATSSSSSSPSFCLGESSPESLCSSGYTDSPQDYDMLKVTLTTTLLTGTKEIVEDAISNWEQEDKSMLSKNSDAAFEKIQTANERSKSNDNSISVYLDACAGEHQENRNDNDNLALSLSLISDTVDHGSNGNNRDRERHGSLTPDTEATGILDDDDVADDDDDDAEDEALYFSISSDNGVRRTSAAYTSSPNLSLFSRAHSALMPELQIKGTGTMSDQGSELVLEKVQITCPPEDISDTPHKVAVTPSAVSLVQDTKDIAQMLNCTETYALVPKLTSCPSRLKVKSHIAVVPLAGACKMTNRNENGLSKLDLKNIKAKVGSRPTQSAPKITVQNKSVSEIGRKAAPRKEEMKAFYGGKRQSPSAGNVKVALVLKPTRGKSTFIKTSPKAAAFDSKKSKRPSVAFSGRPSHCTSAMHTEVAEEQYRVTPRKVAHEVSDKCLLNVESQYQSTIPGEESVEDYWEGTGEALLTLANLDKPRNHTWKVSKLGPTVRPPGKSIRVDKGLVPPPGTGPPGPEGPRPRQSQINGPMLKEVGQSAADGSPMRVKNIQSQSNGLKIPSVNNHNTAKTATTNQTAKTSSTVNQVPTKQATHYPLQKSGLARVSGLNGTVDKNKPRDVHARSTNNCSSSPVPALTAGHRQQSPSRALVPDVVNANAPGTTVSSVPVAVSTNTGSGTTGPPALAFKARPGSRSSAKHRTRLQNGPKPGAVTAKQSQSKEPTEKNNQAGQLWKLLIQANKKVEALATVVQHLFNEREETLKQKKDLSLQLAKLKNELVESSQCCDRLHKEKEEARISLEGVLRRLDEQHKVELVQLEDRLRRFYQTEWDKVHQTYQEEADKCRMLMERQVEEMRTIQEAERKTQEASHSKIMESLREQHETSLQELKRIQEIDLENLDKTLKETETTLSDKIFELSAENAILNEKLKAEEERRILANKSLKDSHTVYLEQELESLKVVLEIKNNQLHQKEKKLMEMDKLVETNVKLEECMTKVQQENEDYKARMDKHAALSKQLSSEQAILQQTLQKESKVNKRLSMENEELLWKLHNGDLLGSPRRLSPTSPLSSPRNSASFPAAAPLSPR